MEHCPHERNHAGGEVGVRRISSQGIPVANISGFTRYQSSQVFWHCSRVTAAEMHRFLTQLRNTKCKGWRLFGRGELSQATGSGSFSRIVTIPVSDPDPMARRFCRPFSMKRDGKGARTIGVAIPTLEFTTATGPDLPAVMVTPWV